MPNQEGSIGHKLTLIPAASGSFNRKVVGVPREGPADGKIEKRMERSGDRRLLLPEFVSFEQGW